MLSLQEMIKKGGSSLLDLIYPPHCALCEKRLAMDERGGLCLRCLSQIPKNIPPFCPSCGRHYAGVKSAPRCGMCEGKHFPFDHLWFVAPYEGALRETLHKLKYEGRKPIANSLAQLLITFLKDELHPFVFEEVLPVPLERQKERERQFNQSALLAKALAEALHIPFSSGNLIRVRATLPQSSLPREKRVENVRDAFRVRNPSLYAGKNLLLIDDIVTTGATLSACAEVLRVAGAREISIVALAGGVTG